MPTSIEFAVDLLCDNWNALLNGESVCLYQSGFYSGQVSKLTQIPEATLFTQLQAAFAQGLEGTRWAKEAAPDRLESYLDDVRAGLKAGAQFPLTTIRKGQTITSLNPLRVAWHELPKWFTARLKGVYGAKTHPLEMFSRFTSGIVGADGLGSVMDHWGSCGANFVTEPYDFHVSDEEMLKEFCAKIGAGFRLAPVPFHHWKTQRVEIYSKGS